MVDYRSESSIGARIKAARKKRGFRRTEDLVRAMPGSKITTPILENIEAGRKADLAVSQLLNISAALGVPPSYLLAPMTRPESALDLPNLSDEVADMTANEFDSWIAAVPTSAYRATTAAERFDIAELNTLREVTMLKREARRLEIVAGIQADSGDADLEGAEPETRNRISRIASDVDRLEKLLTSSGWVFDSESVA
jgi:transcriptional regulator with XRE-family HTH domain